MTINFTSVLSHVALALQEDIGSGDISAQLLPENQDVQALILCRESMVLCGIAWADCAFKAIDPLLDIRWHYRDGDSVKANETLVSLSGNSRAILTAERVALNYLQTLSAVATKTNQYCHKIKHTETKLLDTRKTIPGLRYAQKYAVQCGGGVNHRMGLYDAYLIKENHINACGSIESAINQARKLTENYLVEVEVEDLNEYAIALACHPDVILLDNFPLEDMTTAVKLNTKGVVKLEASGGVNANSIQSIAETGVDYISVGELTKSIKAIDLSLRLLEA